MQHFKAQTLEREVKATLRLSSEELSFGKLLQTDTKSASEMKAVEEYFHENNIDMENTYSCATNGVSDFIGKYRQFIG